MARPMLPLMDKVGLELSLLSKFVLTCQSPRLADAARALGQTPSALSIALHALEQRLGLRLFERRGGGLDLLPSAFWLFRAGVDLLYREQHAREARRQAGERLVRLTVELDLHFAIGRVCKALLRTCQQLIAGFPELLVEWRFAGLDDGDIGDPTGLAAPELAPDRSGHVRIYYGGDGDTAEGAILLYDDPWIVVGARGGLAASAGRMENVTLLRMRREIMDAMLRFARERGFADRLQYRDEEPAQLSTLLREEPGLRLLMPGNLLPTRLGLARHEQVPFEPRFVSSLHGRASGGGEPYTTAFLDAFRHNLAQEQSVVFQPRLTTRQIHFFNLAAQTGSISAAARVANTAQSSVSRHVNQLEAAIGLPLLLRTEEGTRLSPLGEAVHAQTAGIEERQDRIVRKAHDIAAHSEARVTIGTLPSSGHDSALTGKIAEVMTRVHARHPDWQLQIIESSNTMLHERVRSGDLNLALVGMAHAQVARIRLGPSEPLSVVANPAIDLGGRKTLSLADACALPLVLGRQHLSIHQSFAEAARERGVRLHPVVEVGSLALAIAMVRKAPLCTILPASSVQQDIQQGNLAAKPIEDEVAGTLSVIFSAERELSDAERIIIQEFVRVFRPGRRRPPVELGEA